MFLTAFLRECTSLVKKMCPHGLLTNRLHSLKVSHFSILSSQLTDKTSYDDMRQSFWLVVHQSHDQSEALIHLASNKIKTEEQIFWGQDAIKGSRKSWKYWIVFEMLQTLQHDAKKKLIQLKITFFKHGPTGEFGACQKIFFQSKNSKRSKQTAENLNKWKSKKKFLASHVSYYFTKIFSKRSVILVCPTQFSSDKIASQSLRVAVLNKKFGWWDL